MCPNDPASAEDLFERGVEPETQDSSAPHWAGYIVPEKIEPDDPVARRICALIDEDLRAAALQIPRLPHVAAPILEFVNNPKISNQEIIRAVRMDPALAGKILERANAASFGGWQPVSSLPPAIFRLGLVKVSEIALGMSAEMKIFKDRKRSDLLERLWTFSLGTGLACESLAQVSAREAREGAFLTGLFHAVASPAIVSAVSRLERADPPIRLQSSERVLGLMNLLSTDLTLKILESWYLSKEIQNAIRLQDGTWQERRGKPLAQLLVCGKLLATELGLGTRAQRVDMDKHRDFLHLRLGDRRTLDDVSRLVLAGMEAAPKTQSVPNRITLQPHKR
jgi:HD-like signal output (HDOD) protein